MISPPVPPPHSVIARHYDDLGPFYRDAWGDGLHHGYWKTGKESTDEAKDCLRDHVADLAQIKPGDAVCDIGCGYGETARWLASSRMARVMGVTLSKVQFDHVTEAAESSSDSSSDDPMSFPPLFLHEDWLDNTLADASYDAAISIECLPHIGNQARFFREITRILKPDGRLALSTWISAERVPKWAIHVLLLPICREGCLAGLPTANELGILAKSAGLEVDALQKIGPSVKKTWRVILWRLFGKMLTRGDYWRLFWNQLRREQFLASTILRVWIASELGFLDYAVLAGGKPAN